MAYYLLPGEAAPEPGELRAYDREQCRAMLFTMMRLGVDILQRIDMRNNDRALDDRDPIQDTAAAYERVSRAVRRSMMLCDKFHEPEPDTAPPAIEARPTPAATEPAAPKPNAPEPPQSPDHPDTEPPEPAPDQPVDERAGLEAELRLDRPDSLDDQDDAALLHLPPLDQVAIIALDLRDLPDPEAPQPGPDRTSTTPEHAPGHDAPNHPHQNAETSTTKVRKPEG